MPRFEPREGQRRMAAQVADVLAEGGILLAEAGTGTGKTMAYLVPAILSRQRVLVSTGTKNLQEQIFFKDLPALREALGVPFRATYMKGRANYLCKHRFEQLRAGGGSAEVGEDDLALLADWLTHTTTGDRAELEQLPEDSRVWSEVAATAETCLGGDCPQYSECFVTAMRQRAAEADIVIVNHHLLCADASVRQQSFGEVIPPCHRVVLDEAHQLEDVATQYFGVTVSNYRLDELVRDAGALLERGRLPDEDESVRRAMTRAADHARAFFGRVALAHHARARADERLRVGPDWFGDVLADGALLTGSLEGLQAALALAAGGAGGGPAAGEEVNEDALHLARRAGEVRDDLTFLLSAADAGFVYFVERRGRGVFLRASPIDVSAIVRELVIERMQATVLTSATLTVDGSFEYIRGRLGISGEAAELRVPSEFDFARQAILYLPRRMPPPRSPAYADAVAAEVVGLLRRSRGRAFVLFTSHAAMRRVFELAAPAVPYPILLQGTAPRHRLLGQFRSTPNAVLFATSSFWQGVDVVGEQLSAVIIDKLPFASPGDPLTAARIEAIAAAGGDAFGGYQVPLAILALQQGLGRLLRHRTDRGVLAVLDPRLSTMGYGRRFLQSLPPARITRDAEDVGRFFAGAPGRPTPATLEGEE
ncbi:MAG: ATP-dependent DNA helicase [Acidobacteriota bacterium]